MVKRVLFPNSDGGVSVLICHDKDGSPMTELSVEETAAKDIPKGVPFRVVDETDIPSDRSQRDAWVADFSNPDGYGIGAEAWFAERGRT